MLTLCFLLIVFVHLLFLFFLLMCFPDPHTHTLVAIIWLSDCIQIFIRRGNYKIQCSYPSFSVPLPYLAHIFLLHCLESLKFQCVSWSGLQPLISQCFSLPKSVPPCRVQSCHHHSSCVERSKVHSTNYYIITVVLKIRWSFLRSACVFTQVWASRGQCWKCREGWLCLQFISCSVWNPWKPFLVSVNGE